MVAIEHCPKSAPTAAASAVVVADSDATITTTSLSSSRVGGGIQSAIALLSPTLSSTSSSASSVTTTTTSSLHQQQQQQKFGDQKVAAAAAEEDEEEEQEEGDDLLIDNKKKQNNNNNNTNTNNRSHKIPPKMSHSSESGGDSDRHKDHQHGGKEHRNAGAVAKSAVSQRNVDIKIGKKSNMDAATKELTKKVMKLDLTGKELDEYSIKSPKSPIAARLPHQTSLTSSVDMEDRKTLREALYQGIFHRHRRTIFAVGSFLRMLRSRNSSYNTIRSSSEGEDVDEVR